MFKKVKADITKITYETKDVPGGSKRLSVMLGTKEIAHAIYALRDKDMYLGWLETNEDFQNQGIATLLLNYICDMAKGKKLPLEINVINEEVLNEFYYSWFKKKFDPVGNYPNQITTKFNKITIDGGLHPTILLKPQDFDWMPGPSYKKET